MTYSIQEVDGVQNADLLDRFNAMAPDTFPPLKANHYTDGYWWVAYWESGPVAFAGLVPFEPFEGVGYCKRCLVAPDHYGHGLQFNLLMLRLRKAVAPGFRQLVSECRADNHRSAANFRKAGFQLVDPEQRWAGDTSLYWSINL